MTEYQRLFLVQARTDLVVFELFRKQPVLPACHALHYLQMATEMLGKAHAWKHGPRGNTHRAFVGFLRSLSANRQAQKQMGFEGRNENWAHLIRKSVPLANASKTWRRRCLPMPPTPSIPGHVPPRRPHQRSTGSGYGKIYRKPPRVVSSST